MSTRSPSHYRYLYPGRPHSLLSVILIALLCLSGCQESDTSTPESNSSSTNPGDDDGFLQKTVSIEGIDTPPNFSGPRSVIGMDESLYLTWSAAQDDQTKAEEITYRIYVASQSGKQDFNLPVATTSPGATSFILENQANGEPLYIVVRSFDELGQTDQNETEWAAIPNPILYVDENASPGGDGTNPENAVKTIDEAIGEAIGLKGVNIYVAAGNYSEQVLLFEGMGIYGGFPTGFPTGFISTADPARFVTELTGKSKRDVLILPPGQRLTVIDGFVFDGLAQGRRAIVADDCHFRISRCEIKSFSDKGIQIETDLDDEGESTGSIHHCILRKNGGDGIRIEGFIDVALNNCSLIENGQSGLSVDPMVPRRGEKTRIELNRCNISRNNDVGLSIRIDEPIGTDEDPSRIRITLRGILAHGNRDHGASFDVRYPETSAVDLRIRVEHSAFMENDQAGLHLDADAKGDLSIAHCAFLGNQGEESIRLTGDSRVALTRIRSCLIAASAGFGIQLQDAGMLNISKSLLINNNGPAIFTSDPDQLRATISNSSVIGFSPVGIRTEDVNLIEETDEIRTGYLTIHKSNRESSQIKRADHISLPENGTLFHPLNDDRISFQRVDKGQLRRLDGEASTLKERSVWLFSESNEVLTWPGFISDITPDSKKASGLTDTDLQLFPGLPRISSKLDRPVEVMIIQPPPSILSSGTNLSWNFTLTDTPPTTPEGRLYVDGKLAPSETKLQGENLEIISSSEIPDGSRIRIEFDLESDSQIPSSTVSHQWHVAGGGDG